MPLFTDLVVRHLFLPSLMKLLGAVSLACGMVACSTQESAGGQAGRELVKNRPAGKKAAAQVHGVQKGWQRLDPASECYCEKIMALLNTKWDEYRAMNPGVLPRRGYVRTVLTINQRGKVEDIRIDEDKGSYPALTQLALRAIKDTKLPPMPAAVFSSLPKQNHGRQKIQYMAFYLPPR